MPLHTETLVLEEERDRLESDMDELATELAKVPEEQQTEDNPRYATLHQLGQRLEQRRNGVAHLASEYGEEAEVRVGALTAGEYAWVEDNSSDLANQRGGGSVDGAARNHLAAAGLVDAPFLPDEEYANPPDRMEAYLGVVAGDLSAMPVKWLAARINDRTSLEPEEGNSFQDMVAAKASDTAPKTSNAPSEK